MILSRALTVGFPHIVIDYDDESGRTHVVTDGTGIYESGLVYRQTEELKIIWLNLHSDRIIDVYVPYIVMATHDSLAVYNLSFGL